METLNGNQLLIRTGVTLDTQYKIDKTVDILPRVGDKSRSPIYIEKKKK